MSIKKVFVVGSGLMGSGIAQICAQARIGTFLYDIDQNALDKALQDIEWSVGKFIEKGKVSESRSAIMERVTIVTDYEHLPEADLIIEAVFEDAPLKKKIFKELDEKASRDALVASNTSAISITDLAAVTERPERVLGLHFFSPVPMMKAVEVIKGQVTTQDTIEKGRQFAIQVGKEPIMVNRDVAGFVINRINFPSAIEAMRLVERGIATVEDIDKGLRLATGRKMGIFETGDMVGLDVTYAALMAMYRETSDPRWYPPLLLRRKVKAGHLGRKTGRGWYEYNEDNAKKEK